MIEVANAINAEDPGERWWTYDANEKPPPFGHAVKSFWGFDPEYVNLNHGSLGAPPLPVLKRCQELTMLAENNPDKSHRLTYLLLLNEVRKHAANVIGADHEEVVLAPNALHAITTVFANFEWKQGDVIIGANTAYIAVEDSKAKELYHEASFNDTPPSLYAQSDLRVEDKKNKLVIVLDSITPMPSVALPWKEMVKIRREEGAWSIVDGAQSIGQEARPLLLDFFISNCHKWFYAKRGCALLYVPKRNQYIIRSSIPTSAQYIARNDLDCVDVKLRSSNFVDQHAWTATIDLVPQLSVTPAVQFREWLGGEEVINAYCHQLAIAGGKGLAEILGTEVLDVTGELTRNMTTVRLPLKAEGISGTVYTPSSRGKISKTFTDRLLTEFNVSATCFFYQGRWWCRCSAQVYNELADFEYIGRALKKFCEDIEEPML
ncbi:PLP-dependent transferase [Rhodofomes roseus]|uniref:PLP-dependent transferase n=1 Tax=Rhodofomes roseus TaxID=34475 RepID=A0ABQ8KKM3_9APHY|nr:PLP-dependent transferase [Rhodofomes roseus]KAH9838651.1 PLP-dependent transferase [Rhodofomes roseus]